MYLGYCGLLTGQHLGNSPWSVSLNQRFIGKQKVPYLPTIQALLAGVQNVGFTLRDALLEQPSYTVAAAHLRSVKIPAPAYLIAAGSQRGEGVVITRDRNGTSEAHGTGRGFWPLDVASGAWYRLETNFDNWEPITDGRRQAAHKSMDKLGQAGADTAGLIQVLSTPPVLADDTTYTASMQNDVGEYSTLVRQHDAQSAAQLWQRKLDHVSEQLQLVVKWFRSQQASTPTFVEFSR